MQSRGGQVAHWAPAAGLRPRQHTTPPPARCIGAQPSRVSLQRSALLVTSAAAAGPTPEPSPARRSLLQLAALTAALGNEAWRLSSPAAAAAADDGTAPAAAAAAEPGFVPFSNPGQGYALQLPAVYERVDKAGADALFQDPERHSSTVGVTVYPVTIASLAEFGDLAAVGERLLGAERDKESTLEVAMVAAAEGAAGPGGPPLYSYEYELSSTRGRKRILSCVAIARRRLFILNATAGCDKESCGGAEAALGALRRVAASFEVS